MSQSTNREIHLASRPTGMPKSKNFKLAETPMPKTGQGQFLVRNILMSVVNYKTCGNLEAAVKTAAPQGIDVYFENVGGEHLEVALSLMNRLGRIVACGMISQYNAVEPPPGPCNVILVIAKLLTPRDSGFLVETIPECQA